MQKSVNSVEPVKKKGWFARRKDKKDAIALFDKLYEKLGEKGLKLYKKMTPLQKETCRGKLAEQITHEKATADAKHDYKKLHAFLQMASATGEITEWEDNEVDYKLTEALVDVFVNTEYTDLESVVSARMAVHALWNNNYYHSEFWETLLEHNDPCINAFIIRQMAKSEGGDEVLMKNQEKLASKLYLSDLGRKFLVKNFSGLNPETRRQILGILSTHGIPTDMTHLIPQMIDYPELKVPTMTWMISGIKIQSTKGAMNQIVLQKIMLDAVENIKMQIGKTLDKIKSSLDEAKGLERVVAAAVFKNFAVKVEVELGEEELEFLKKIIINPADHPKLRELSAKLLIEIESEEAKKIQEEAIEKGAEFFDESDVQKQLRGYDIVRLMTTVGSEYAKEILETMRDEALDDLKDNGASKEQKEFALKIVNDSAKLLE